MTSTAMNYAYLLRLHKPIGTLLLLWPTLWGLWLASAGFPASNVLLIFVAGTFLMRSAGCAVNDFADRHVDGRVTRTKNRPLAQGVISSRGALLVAAVLSLVAFLLVLQCNWLTIELSIIAAIIAFIYPFLKRFTHLPQVGLGVAFSWGVPMAFAAVLNEVPLRGWFLFLACVLWPIIYDTYYAMVDREDDVKVGVKSTAILFAQRDKWILGLLQFLFLVMLTLVGVCFNLSTIYYSSLVVVGLLFVYQQQLIKHRERDKCFQAFLHSNWVGLVIFLGIYLGLLS